MIEIVITKTHAGTLTEVIHHTPGGPVSYRLLPGEEVTIVEPKR